MTKVPNIIYSIFLFLVFLIIANVIKNLIQSKIDVAKSNSIILSEFSILMYYFIIIVGIIVALINLGVQIATIVTLLGTFGLAMALAIKSCFEDIIAGIYISTNDLYNIGDKVDIGEINGYIHDINLFYTTFSRVGTYVSVVINNSKIRESNIINWSKFDYINCENLFSISNTPLNDKNYNKIFDIIRESLSNCEYIVDKSRIKVNVLNANDESGTSIMVLSPIKSSDWRHAFFEINNLIREALFNNNIILRLF